MKAAVVTEPTIIQTQETPLPVCEKGEVLVRVAYCGICGSDVPRVWQGTAHSYPIVLGHEFSGTIEQVGEGVSASMIGKRVSGIPLVPCMECDECKEGSYALCGHYSFVGSRRPGAMAQYVAVPVENVYELGDNVSDIEGAFFEPATVAMHGIDVAGFKPGSTVAIMGIGIIGILTAQILSAMGASVVVGLGRRKERLEIAKQAGVDNLVSTQDDNWLDDALAWTDKRGFDYVFDTSGSNAAMVDSLRLAAPHGTVCYIGTPKKPMEISVRDWEIINRKELTVRGSWMSYSAPWPGTEWSRVDALFAEGKLSISSSMIQAICNLDSAKEAFDHFAPGNSPLGKVLLNCE